METNDNNANREETLFVAARALKKDVERKAFLDAACQDDAELRGRIEEMLSDATAAEDYFNEAAPGEFDQTLTENELGDLSPETPPFGAKGEGPGTQIGKYKLLQQIGEGGMGDVYMAEEEGALRRKVAFKIIKLGMDTKNVVARFEAERQALALMDHRNIAKVFDAGATETGRPYFVMELVKGIPITEYCDKHKLSTEKRLELFIPVCEAIQHAHQKGIIHRDIKPSNVLVAHFDGKPVPMVIDFGIAKATNQRLTEKTQFTEHGQFIGTPAYVSPEQSEGSQLDIDTRSDIYSLGVLLYELLTGSTPFPDKRLRSAGWREMQRIIQEEEPPRPSTRLNTLTEEERTTITKNHPEGLGRIAVALRRELDWIVMMCLEKDRSRRYETANGLAMDIGRYLKGEAINAVPPSKTYQLSKLVRKHKKTFAMAAVITVILSVATIVSITQAQEAIRQRNRVEKINDWVKEDLLGLVDGWKSDPGTQDKANLLFKDAILKSAEGLKERFKDEPEIEGEIRQVVGEVLFSVGRTAESMSNLVRSLELLERSVGRNNTNTLRTRIKIGQIETQTSRPHDERLERRLMWTNGVRRLNLAYLDARKIQGPLSPLALQAAGWLGSAQAKLFTWNGHVSAADQSMNRALEILGPLPRPADSAYTIDEWHQWYQIVATIREKQGRYSESRQIMEGLREMEAQRNGTEPTTGFQANFRMKLAASERGWLPNTGDQRCEEELKRGWEISTKAFGTAGPTAQFANSLSDLFIDQGRFEDARQVRSNHLQAVRQDFTGDGSWPIPGSTTLLQFPGMMADWDAGVAEVDRMIQEGIYPDDQQGSRMWDLVLFKLSGADERFHRLRIAHLERMLRQAGETNTIGRVWLNFHLLMPSLPDYHRDRLVRIARRSLVELKKTTDDPGAVLTVEGFAALRNDDFVEAERHLSRVMATNPRTSYWIFEGYGLAMALAGQGKTNEAVATLERSNRVMEGQINTGLFLPNWVYCSAALVMQGEAEEMIYGRRVTPLPTPQLMAKNRASYEPVWAALREADWAARQKRFDEANRLFGEVRRHASFSVSQAHIAGDYLPKMVCAAVLANDLDALNDIFAQLEDGGATANTGFCYLLRNVSTPLAPALRRHVDQARSHLDLSDGLLKQQIRFFLKGKEFHALDLHRRGEFTEALRWLREMMEDSDVNVALLAQAYAATAVHPENPQEAAELLRDSREKFHRYHVEPSPELYPPDWVDVALVDKALLEAEAMISSAE